MLDSRRSALDAMRAGGGTALLIGEVGAEAAAWARANGLTIERRPQRDPTELAAALARDLPHRPERVIVTRRAAFADALAGAALAAHTGWPVLFTDAAQLSPATAKVIRELRPDRVHVLGGIETISDDVVVDLIALGVREVTRLAGKDRAATAVAIADEGIRQGMDPRRPVIATGWNFPDALAGSALTRGVGGPILLAHPRRLPTATAAWLAARRGQLDWAIVLGGDSAVSADVEDQLRDVLR